MTSNGRAKPMIFGGEGLFLATMQGTGSDWSQTLPFSRLADRILEFAPAAGGKSIDEGSVISGAVELFQQ